MFGLTKCVCITKLDTYVMCMSMLMYPDECMQSWWLVHMLLIRYVHKHQWYSYIHKRNEYIPIYSNTRLYIHKQLYSYRYLLTFHFLYIFREAIPFMRFMNKWPIQYLIYIKIVHYFMLGTNAHTTQYPVHTHTHTRLYNAQYDKHF